jgi:hypothetical protein
MKAGCLVKPDVAGRYAQLGLWAKCGGQSHDRLARVGGNIGL